MHANACQYKILAEKKPKLYQKSTFKSYAFRTVWTSAEFFPNVDDQYNFVYTFIIQYLSIDSLTSYWNASMWIVCVCVFQFPLKQNHFVREKTIAEREFHWIKSCVPLESSMIR